MARNKLGKRLTQAFHVFRLIRKTGTVFLDNEIIGAAHLHCPVDKWATENALLELLETFRGRSMIEGQTHYDRQVGHRIIPTEEGHRYSKVNNIANERLTALPTADGLMQSRLRSQKHF